MRAFRVLPRRPRMGDGKIMPTLSIARSLLIAAFATVLPGVVWCQEPHGGSPTCTDDRFAPVLVDSLVMSEPFTPIVTMKEGRAYTTSIFWGSTVLVHRSAGASVDTIAKAGKSAADYRFIRALRLNGDALVVFDAGTLRRTVVMPSGAVATQQPIPLRMTEDGILMLNGEDYILNSVAPAHPLPLHLVNADGDLVRSFGEKRPSGPPHEPFVLGWAGMPDRFWAAEMDRYRLVLWDTSGSIMRVVKREPEWWVARQFPAAVGSREEWPYPDFAGLLGIHQRADVLIVVGRTPLLSQEMRTGEASSPRDWAQYFDTHVEFLDLRSASAELIASCRFDAGLAFLVPPQQYLATYEEPLGDRPGVYRFWDFPQTALTAP